MAFGLQNFMAASRKPNLKPFGLMAQSQDLSWIFTNYPILSLATLASASGSQDGKNPVYTLSTLAGNGSIVFLNGVGLYEGLGYTRSGLTITFNPGYIPQANDQLRALVW